MPRSRAWRRSKQWEHIRYQPGRSENSSCNGARRQRERTSNEFDVHRLDDKRWEWVAYPKMGEGVRFSGTVEGDEEKATTAAKVEIDARLGFVAEPRKSAPPFRPDPSQRSTSNWDDAARIATSRTHRNAALLDGGGSQVLPPLVSQPELKGNISQPELKATIETVPPANSAATVNVPPAVGTQCLCERGISGGDLVVCRPQSGMSSLR